MKKYVYVPTLKSMKPLFDFYGYKQILAEFLKRFSHILHALFSSQMSTAIFFFNKRQSDEYFLCYCGVKHHFRVFKHILFPNLVQRLEECTIYAQTSFKLSHFLSQHL